MRAALDRYESTRAVRAESRLATALFFIPLGVWFCAIILWASCYASFLTAFITVDEARGVLTGIKLACLFTLALRELVYGRRDMRSLIGFAIAVLLAGFSVFREGMISTIFSGILFIFLARDIPFKRIARFLLVEISVLVAFVVLSSLAGIIVDATVEESGRGVRHALGFVHPNTPGAFSFYIACLWAYVRGRKFSWADAVGMAVLSCAVFALTSSRSSFAVTILLVLTMTFARFVPRRVFTMRAVKLAAIGSIAAIAVVAIVLSVFYDPSVEWMSWLNKLSSRRFENGHEVIAQLGLLPFGQDVPYGGSGSYNRFTGQWGTPTWLIVDDIYVRLLVFYGPLFLAAVLAICTATTARLYQYRQMRALAILVLIALHGVFETCPADFMFNPFLLLLALPMAPPPKESSA